MIELLTGIPDLVAAGGWAGWVAVLVVAVRALLAWHKGKAEIRQQEAATDRAVAEAAVSLVEPLRGQIAYLTAELVASRGENQQLRHDMAELRSENQQLSVDVAELRSELTRLTAQLSMPAPAPTEPDPEPPSDTPEEN